MSSNSAAPAADLLQPRAESQVVEEAVVEREFVERVAALYRQAVPSGWGSVAVALCLVLVLWRFAPQAMLIGWFVLTLCAISFRIPLIHGFRADAQRATHAHIWARRYSWMIGGVGTCWALAPFLFLDGSDPFAIAALVMVIALFAGGAIASQSYLFPVAREILSFAVLPTAVRLLTFQDMSYVPLGITLLMFYLFVLAYARVQSRQIGEAIRLKYENLSLIEALQAQKEQADAMRTSAEQASLAKSRFLAAASHDLRQPLHALGLFSAALHEMGAEPQRRAVVDNIFNSIDALESLVSSLLDLSRLDAGHIQPQLQHVPLALVFERLHAQYTPLAQSRDLALDFAAQDAIVFSDPALLERLLGNLIANAIQYTSRGAVSVRALPEEQGVTVEVRDTGMGIAQAYRERVFDEFFQLSNPERDRRKGLGLGLAIVRRLAAMLDHPLSLESDEGKGSCFRLRIRSGDASLVVPETAAPATNGDILHGKTILVIDDEIAVLDAMQELLGRWGCKVLRATEVSEALASVATCVPHLIVADLRLPRGESGIDAIERVCQALDRTLPAVILTGDIAVEALKDATRHGYPLLHKPVRAVTLRATLSQLLVGNQESGSAALAPPNADCALLIPRETPKVKRKITLAPP